MRFVPPFRARPLRALPVRTALFALLLALLAGPPLLAACIPLPHGRGEPARAALAGGSKGGAAPSGDSALPGAPGGAGSPGEPGGPGGAAQGDAGEAAGSSRLVRGPEAVRGIYLSGYTAGNPARVARLLDYMRQNGLNAAVIDVKDETGALSFPLPGTTAEALGADRHKIADLGALLRLLHQNGIYVIGRIVTFADPFAAGKRPEWAIRQDGRPWTDENHVAWLDPSDPHAWTYNIEIGVAAAKLGFDEIQFDEVRFPQKMPPGYAAATAAGRVRAVTGFLEAAREAIHRAAGVPVSADVIAISSVAPGDSAIGQSYPEMARAVDFASPMDYPSLYGRGALGIANPAARPYDVVWQTVAAAEARTADLPLALQRPWIQDFDLGTPAYGPKEVEAELEALAAAGIRSFLLWNAASLYTPGVDFSVIDRTPIKPPSPVWLPALYGLLATRIPVALPAAVPAAPRGMATSVRLSATAGGYSAELWATARPLPTNDPRITQGRLLLVVGAASQPVALAPQPAPGARPEPVRLATGTVAELAPSGAGVVLRWGGPGRVAWVWAADRATAVAAAESERVVPLLEGR
ncbi:MAG: hypothetical protein IRZ26_04765 [Clostridia bacterium]|nr:hypothetical protein [Clostridia bacterium]